MRIQPPGLRGWFGLSLRLAVFLFAVPSFAIECPDPRLAVDLPKELRAKYDNPDGSCVQCSIGMNGNDQSADRPMMLLWDYDADGDGKIDANERKVRGGSGPSRVAAYARARGIRIFNITGRDTIEWVKWAARNGRGCAIGFEPVHFQTFMGHDPKNGKWWVCDNNSTQRIDEFDAKTFRRKHYESGPWIVILDYPPSPTRPVYEEWWK